MEGPSIVILVEEADKFIGSRVTKCSGTSKVIDPKALCGQKLLDLKSWGKHFLLVFEKSILKIHFLMFGSYRIDEPRPEMKPRLSLVFKTGELNVYSCSIQELTAPLEELYDWRVDVMSKEWSEKLAVQKLESQPNVLVCDALLDQTIFAGAGNIIKNEVLFRMRLHPEVKLRALSSSEIQLLVRETRLYSLQFYIWKKQFMLRKNWEMYRKKICPLCGGAVQLQPAGKLKRRSFFCPRCQKQAKTPQKSQAHLAQVKKRLTAATAKITALKKEMAQLKAQSGAEREH